MYQWFRILILIGGIITFMTEMFLIFKDCYLNDLNFFMGTWSSWFFIISGIFQIRLSRHYEDVKLVYQVFTLFISSLTSLLTCSAFIFAIVMRIDGYSYCRNLSLLVIFEITSTLVPMFLSTACLIKCFCQRNVRISL